MSTILTRSVGAFVALCFLSGLSFGEVYRDPGGRFTVEVPPGWTSKSESGVAFLSGGSLSVVISVVVGGGANPALVERLIDQFQKQWGNPRITGVGPHTASGAPGFWTMYEGNDPKWGRYVLRAVSATAGNDAVLLSFACAASEWPKRKAEAEAIESSLVMGARATQRNPAPGAGTWADAPPAKRGNQTPSGARGGLTLARAVPVAPIRGNYCQAYGPPGWVVSFENAVRYGFDLQMSRPDGTAGIEFHILPGGRSMLGLPGSETPERLVAASLTAQGQRRVTIGKPQQFAENMFVVGFRTPEVAFPGSAVYTVMPMGNGDFMIALRFVHATPERFAEAVAVLQSTRCRIPSVPAAAARPLPTRRELPNRGEGDSEYNRWLETETYHDPATGENVWVSPSHDYSMEGPEGEGYYRQNGNDIIKLKPGFSP